MSKDNDSTMPTPRRLTRREFLRRAGQLGFGAAGLSLLAACGGTPAAPANPTPGGAAGAAPATAAPAQGGNAQVTISMMGWGSILEKENVQKGLDLFQSKNPDIKVNWLHTPNEEYETKLKTALAGGTAPDVFWASNMADYVSRGVVMDITDRVKNDPVIGKPDYFIQPAEEQRAMINGKWYGIGSCWVVHHLYYNADMLQKAGVEPPPTDPAKAWTWDQFLENARKLTVDSAGKHPGESGFDPNNVQQWGVDWNTWSLPRDVMIYSNGGDAFSADYKLHHGEPAALEAIQQVADLFNVHYVAPHTVTLSGLNLTAVQLMASQKLAMAMNGSWLLQDIAKQNFKNGAGVLPKMKTAVTEAQAHMHMIYKDTKNPDAAWKLLAFLSSDDYQLGLIKAGLWLPSHTSLLTQDGIKKWLTPGVHPAGYEQIATDYLGKAARNYFYPAGFSEVDQILTTALDPVWVGKSSVKDALTADVLGKAQAVLDKAHA
ncbi:MAG TPA: sugar ABC transporter substrate-binding protein, partial [Roseiflexaceae bacterium]